MIKRLLGCFVLSVMALAAADASGKWAGTFGQYPAAMELKQEGEVLTGNAGPAEGPMQQIEKGTIQAAAITFELETPLGRYQFKMELKGDEISGTAVSNGGGDTVKVDFKRS